MFGKGHGDPLAAWLVCPACRFYCSPTMYLAGEMAIFDCVKPHGCGTRYFVGLGERPTLTAAPLGREVAA